MCWREYYRQYSVEYNRRNRVPRYKMRMLKKKKPGFLYFFKSVAPGFYKVGYTKNWSKRKLAYQGPSAIKKLFFVRPVPDGPYAESQMKAFLCANGYRLQVGKTMKSDWFVRKDEMCTCKGAGFASEEQ